MDQESSTLAFGLAFVALVFARIYLDARFRMSLRREAPQLFERVAGKSARRRFLSRAPIDSIRMLLLRSYRTELAAHPVSRAWASWISAIDWIFLALAVVLGIAALRNAG